MHHVAVVVKTLDREAALLNCLRSVRRRLDAEGIRHRVYVADDGSVSERKRRAYRRLREEGHCVLEFKEPVGASRARNELLGRLASEEAVLRLDDDFELTEETNVGAMSTILERVPSLGAVADLERQVGLGKGTFSGWISDGQGYFEQEGDLLVRRMLPPEHFEFEEVGGYRFARCDFTRNMLLVRREALADVRWEERLPFEGEHEDFMLELGESGWDVGFTPDSIHLHRDDLAARGRSLARGERSRRRAEAMEVFREKWGVGEKTVRRTATGTLRAGLVFAAKKAGFGP